LELVAFAFFIFAHTSFPSVPIAHRHHPPIAATTMAELAGFVATVLRDRTVAELQARVDALEGELERRDRHSVRITGPAGLKLQAMKIPDAESMGRIQALCRPGGAGAPSSSPPSMHGQATHAVHFYHNGSSTAVIDPNLPFSPRCQVEDIETCELHIGNEKVANLGESLSVEYLGSDDDDNEIVAIAYHFPTVQILVQLRLYEPAHADHGRNPRTLKNRDVRYVNFSEVRFMRTNDRV
jgi:hypothetical protein